MKAKHGPMFQGEGQVEFNNASIMLKLGGGKPKHE